MKTMIAAAIASVLKIRFDEAADVASVDIDFECYVASIVEKSNTSAIKPARRSLLLRPLLPLLTPTRHL